MKEILLSYREDCKVVFSVIPANAGIQTLRVMPIFLDSRPRGNDEYGVSEV